MNFQGAIKSVLKDKYATFSGRASRSEFWWFQLFAFLLSIAVNLILGFLFAFGAALVTTEPSVIISIAYIPPLLLFLALLLPSIAVIIRRLHDYNLSGWWYLAFIVVFVGCYMLAIFVAVFLY